MKATNLKGKLVTNPFSRDAVVQLRGEGKPKDIVTAKEGATVEFGPIELLAGEKLVLAEHGGKGATVSGEGILDNTDGKGVAEVQLRDGEQHTTLLRVAAGAKLPFHFSASRKGSLIEIVSKPVKDVGKKPTAPAPAPAPAPKPAKAPAPKKKATRK